MAVLLRLVRFAMVIAIVAALTAQYDHGSQRPTFTAANYFSYYTVLSNFLLVVLFFLLAAKPELAHEPGFSVFRGTVTLGITATGLVYAVLLAPSAADVDVTLGWVDFIVHTLAPIVGFVDWVVDPPDRRPSVGVATSWLVLPLVWLIYTLIRGPIADWYPYPFLDPDQESVASIVVTCIGIAVVFGALAAGLRWWAGRRALAPAYR